MADTESVTLQVKGMTCTGCAAGLQRALESEPTVKSASVSFAAGLATVGGMDLRSERLIEVIRSRGFDAAVYATEGDSGRGTLSQIEHGVIERSLGWDCGCRWSCFTGSRRLAVGIRSGCRG